ncbi:MAG: NnrU family protein, partial [Rhodospirillales bacterium]|nr:NnrU family protein [Rhodospirillales bacterium]
MSGMASLMAAVALFAASHLLLAAPTVRQRLVRWIGEAGFRITFAGLAIILLGWVMVAYGSAPVVDLWYPPTAVRHLSLSLMPFAFILLVGGLTTANPSLVGSDSGRVAAAGPRGITKITRHPVMWGMMLWSAVHILANGDLASLLFFGGFLLTAGLGSLHLDQRMALIQGERWQRFAAVTSHIPFAAIISGRQSWSWSE